MKTIEEIQAEVKADEQASVDAAKLEAPGKCRKTLESGKPVFFREEQRRGWTAAMRVYLLWCKACELYSSTHAAGYGKIRCSGCRATHRVMTWERFRDKVLPGVLRGVLVVSTLVFVILAVLFHQKIVSH